MYSHDLYDKVLIKPAKEGADSLLIVSGYATAAMASTHLNKLGEINAEIKVRLLIGMCRFEGISETNHKGFVSLMTGDGHSRFICSYLFQGNPVHSKVYIWCRNNEPLKAFTGSANYTQLAFSNLRREVLADCSAQRAIDYFQRIEKDTIYCDHQDAESYLIMYRESQIDKVRLIGKDSEDSKLSSHPELIGLPYVKISLLDRSGALPQRSGLNWGQRPEERRHPDQAYIRIPARVARSSYFPPRAIHFTILTDDGITLTCSIAQDKAKAVHTPLNNASMGRYFRRRLGLPYGSFVRLDDLVRYGRTDVEFYKIDDETFYMNFGV